MQLFSVNEEFLVSTISSECADYVPVLCTHRPSLLPIECFSEIFGLVFRAALGSFGIYRKDAQTGSFRGSKSRNKVFVGEPAYGSLPFLIDFVSIINIFQLRTIVSLEIIVSHHYVSKQDDIFIWIGHLRDDSFMCCLVSKPFPFNKSLLFVIEYESNLKYRKLTILYGGSLGSLFDEERSKVRESNANCRTH